MKKKSWILGLSVILAALLVACSADKGLDATSWGLESYRDAGGNLSEVLPASVVTAHFQATQVSGNSGCNSFSGSYQASGGKIDFGPLASTMMFCEDPAGIMDQESAFLAAMDLATKYNLQGNTLVMMDDRGDTLLVFKSVFGQ